MVLALHTFPFGQRLYVFCEVCLWYWFDSHEAFHLLRVGCNVSGRVLPCGNLGAFQCVFGGGWRALESMYAFVCGQTLPTSFLLGCEQVE